VLPHRFAVRGQAGERLSILTPWQGEAPVRLPGKHDHMVLLMRGQNFLHGADGPAHPMQFSPLMSQPLVEFCLSVPTWQWCNGGVNRALARAAFAHDLPPAIVRRTSKAGPDSVMRTLFALRRPQIRDLLLDGLLARHGILDRTATEHALSVDVDREDPVVYRLLDLVEAEAWARVWTA